MPVSTAPATRPTCPGSEHEDGHRRRVAGAVQHRAITAGAALERVLALSGEQRVSALGTAQQVASRSAGEQVVARTASDGGHAPPAAALARAAVFGGILGAEPLRNG